jgi:hypothetical protein
MTVKEPATITPITKNDSNFSIKKSPITTGDTSRVTFYDIKNNNNNDFEWFTPKKFADKSIKKINLYKMLDKPKLPNSYARR